MMRKTEENKSSLSFLDLQGAGEDQIFEYFLCLCSLLSLAAVYSSNLRLLPYMHTRGRCVSMRSRDNHNISREHTEHSLLQVNGNILYFIGNFKINIG